MRRRSLSTIVAVAALVAGCGGDQRGETTAPPPRPSPAAAFRALAAAARSGDESRVRALLAPGTRPSVAEELTERLGSFPASTPVILAEQIDASWAVAALAGPRREEGTRRKAAFAVPLKLVGGQWKAQIGGLVEIRPLGPDPGSTVQVPVTQVAAQFSALADVGEAGLWLDGKALAATSQGTAARYTAYGATPSLEKGVHVVVAFAEAGGSASAVAWTFRRR